jgi:hypothetical protein
VECKPDKVKLSICVLTKDESETVPESIRELFNTSGHAIHHESGN